MKMSGTTVDVFTNATKESKFTINASAQAFRILSSGMYQHKIAAIVRELTCNAYDSHISAGKSDVPFKVVLPNTLHKYFEVEDFGVGLDDEGVRDVATSYFTTTKTHSNSVIGGFGLGFKTPFSYTTAFTIIARKDGVERLYSAYIGSDGAPCVNLMREADTTECDGVKVTVPVKETDFNEFLWEAKWILSFFEVTPIVPGGIELVYPGIMTKLKQDGVVSAMAESNFYSSLYQQGKLYAVMGGVCYPLNIYDFNEDLNDSTMIQHVLQRKGATVFFNFGIGELEPAASRETLSMTEETKANLVFGINESVRMFSDKVIAEVDALPNIIDAMKYVQEKFGLLKLFSSRITYNGKNYTYAMNKTLFRRNQAHIASPKRASNKVDYKHSVTFADFIEGKVKTILYTEKDEKDVGIVKYTRSMARESGGLLVLRNTTERRIKKWLELYGFGENIEVFQLKDLREEDKQNRKQTRSSSAPYVRVAKEEVKARSSKASNLSYVNASQVFNLSDGDYLYYESEGRAFQVEEVVDYPTSFVQLALKDLGMENYRVLIMNKLNEKKIKAAGVRELGEVVRGWRTANQEKIDLAHLRGKVPSNKLLLSLIEYTSSNEVVKDILQKKNGNYSLQDVLNSESDNCPTSTSGFVSEGLVNTVREDIDTIKEEIIKQYPLLQLYMSQWYNVTDDVLNQMKYYINLLDNEKDSVTLLALAA